MYIAHVAWAGVGRWPFQITLSRAQSKLSAALLLRLQSFSHLWLNCSCLTGLGVSKGPHPTQCGQDCGQSFLLHSWNPTAGFHLMSRRWFSKRMIQMCLETWKWSLLKTLHLVWQNALFLYKLDLCAVMSQPERRNRIISSQLLKLD